MPVNFMLVGISKNPYYLFGLTFNSSPLERKRSVFRDALVFIPVQIAIAV